MSPLTVVFVDLNKVCGPLRKVISDEFQACNWSKNSFGKFTYPKGWTFGRFPFNQVFQKFVNRGGKWDRNFPEKFQEILKAVESPKCEPSNRKL